MRGSVLGRAPKRRDDTDTKLVSRIEFVTKRGTEFST